MGIDKYLIINDIHIPFEDQPTVNIFFQMLKEGGYKRLFLNGDIPEFESVSSHRKRPGCHKFLIEEIAACNRFVDQIRKVYSGPIVWIEGNHEWRLGRYLLDQAPELIGSFSCRQAFRVDLLEKFSWIPYHPRQWVRAGDARLWLRHEPVGGGMNHAKQTSDNVAEDCAYGHTHTIQSYTIKKLGGKRIMAHAMPAACDFSHENFDYRGPKDRWVNGFTEVEAETKSGRYSLRCIETTDGLALHNGKFYRAAKSTQPTKRKKHPSPLGME